MEDESFESISSADATTPLRINDDKDEWGEWSREWCILESSDSGIEGSTEDRRNIKDNDRHKEIQAIRDLMPLKSDIKFEGCDDTFLLCFLQARKFNVEAAFALLCNYYEFRKDNPKLLSGLKASELRYILEDGFPCVLPYLDSNGATYMVLFPGSWDFETFSVEVMLKAFILSLEHLSEIESVQKKGIVLLVDFSGWTTSHASNLSISYIRKIITIFQDCYPVIFKCVHLINQPWYINVLISLLKPFLKEKQEPYLYLHGNNLTTLHKHISQETLPAEFGGDRSEVDQGYWARVLLEEEQRSDNLLRKGSVECIGRNPLRYSIEVIKDAPNFIGIGETEPLLLQE